MMKSDFADPSSMLKGPKLSRFHQNHRANIVWVEYSEFRLKSRRNGGNFTKACTIQTLCRNLEVVFRYGAKVCYPTQLASYMYKQAILLSKFQ